MSGSLTKIAVGAAPEGLPVYPQKRTPAIAVSDPFEAATLLRVAEERGLEGIVSKRRLALIWCANDWVKLKTTPRREGNREQWRLFERN